MARQPDWAAAGMALTEANYAITGLMGMISTAIACLDTPGMHDDIQGGTLDRLLSAQATTLETAEEMAEASAAVSSELVKGECYAILAVTNEREE